MSWIDHEPPLFVPLDSHAMIHGLQQNDEFDNDGMRRYVTVDMTQQFQISPMANPERVNAFIEGVASGNVTASITFAWTPAAPNRNDVIEMHDDSLKAPNPDIEQSEEEETRELRVRVKNIKIDNPISQLDIEDV